MRGAAFAMPCIFAVIREIKSKTYENQPGDGKMHRIPGTSEECLESLSILLKNQAAKPKRHR